mgnify:FL=1
MILSLEEITLTEVETITFIEGEEIVLMTPTATEILGNLMIIGVGAPRETVMTTVIVETLGETPVYRVGIMSPIGHKMVLVLTETTCPEVAIRAPLVNRITHELHVFIVKRLDI